MAINTGLWCTNNRRKLFVRMSGVFVSVSIELKCGLNDEIIF